MNPPSRGVVVQVLRDDEIYLAEDTNRNLLVSKNFLKSGILVNVTRKDVIEFQKTLTNEEKEKFREYSRKKNLIVLKVPEFNSLYYFGDDVKELKKCLSESKYVPSGVISIYVKMTASWLDDPNFQHYVFVI